MFTGHFNTNGQTVGSENKSKRQGDRMKTQDFRKINVTLVLNKIAHGLRIKPLGIEKKCRLNEYFKK